MTPQTPLPISGDSGGSNDERHDVASARTDDLEGRNRADDIRQDKSDQRQDRTERRQRVVEERTAGVEEVQQKASDVFSVILGTLGRLDAGQSRIEQAMAQQTTRMDKLVDTTNHRLDLFLETMQEWESQSRVERSERAVSMLAYQATLSRALAEKADKKDVEGLHLFWAEIKKNRILQAVLAGFLIGGAPVVYANWATVVDRMSAALP